MMSFNSIFWFSKMQLVLCISFIGFKFIMYMCLLNLSYFMVDQTSQHKIMKLVKAEHGSGHLNVYMSCEILFF